MLQTYKLSIVQLRFTPWEWPAFIRSALPFGLTSLALTFNFHADTVILSRTQAPEVVGWYNLAYGLVFSIVAITDGFLTVMTPSLAREHLINPDQVHQWTRTSIGWLTLFALPACTGAAMLSSQLIASLYGAQFMPSAALFSILAWDIPLLLFIAFCGNVTSAVGLERPAARVYLIATFMNIGLNLLFIPAYGAQGAATITLITDALASLLFLRLLGGQMQFKFISTLLLKIVGATLIMSSVLWLAQDLPLVLAIGAGCLSYVIAATMLRAYDRSILIALGARLQR